MHDAPPPAILAVGFVTNQELLPGLAALLTQLMERIFLFATLSFGVVGCALYHALVWPAMFLFVAPLTVALGVRTEDDLILFGILILPILVLLVLVFMILLILLVLVFMILLILLILEGLVVATLVVLLEATSAALSEKALPRKSLEVSRPREPRNDANPT